jgi:hypothetical protein
MRNRIWDPQIVSWVTIKKVYHPKPRKTLVQRFWDKVQKTEGCWLWTGSKYNKGYGSFNRTRAHRFSYELHYGPIPVDLFVCHHCDNPPCVNPSHLFLGTALDNTQDELFKERHPKQTPCDYKGKHYHSLKECWEINNNNLTTYNGFMANIKKGFTIEQALTMPTKPYTSSKCEYNNKQYKSLFVCYKDNINIAQVNIPSFILRVSKGMSIHEALITPGKLTISSPCIYKGKQYESLTDCYRDNINITPVNWMTFLRRINKGFSVEVSLETPPYRL